MVVFHVVRDKCSFPAICVLIICAHGVYHDNHSRFYERTGGVLLVAGSHINPCCPEFVLRNTEVDLYLPSFLKTVTAKANDIFRCEGKLTLYCQLHGFWCISDHGIYLDTQNILISTLEVLSEHTGGCYTQQVVAFLITLNLPLILIAPNKPRCMAYKEYHLKLFLNVWNNVETITFLLTFRNV